MVAVAFFLKQNKYAKRSEKINFKSSIPRAYKQQKPMIWPKKIIKIKNENSKQLRTTKQQKTMRHSRSRSQRRWRSSTVRRTKCMGKCIAICQKKCRSKSRSKRSNIFRRRVSKTRSRRLHNAQRVFVEFNSKFNNVEQKIQEATKLTEAEKREEQALMTVIRQPVFREIETQTDELVAVGVDPQFRAAMAKRAYIFEKQQKKIETKHRVLEQRQNQMERLAQQYAFEHSKLFEKLKQFEKMLGSREAEREQKVIAKKLIEQMEKEKQLAENAERLKVEQEELEKRREEAIQERKIELQREEEYARRAIQNKQIETVKQIENKTLRFIYKQAKLLTNDYIKQGELVNLARNSFTIAHTQSPRAATEHLMWFLREHMNDNYYSSPGRNIQVTMSDILERFKDAAYYVTAIMPKTSS